LAHSKEFLAQVAEKYYLDGLNQTEVAKQIGVDRSVVSRMLAEARREKIVEIRINHPLSSDRELETEIRDLFGLKKVFVATIPTKTYTGLIGLLGKAGASVLMDVLQENLVLGISWGTAVNAVVNAVDEKEIPGVKIVQLVGAVGTLNSEYNGHGLVQRLAAKLGCEGYFLNAPFYLEKSIMVDGLKENQNIQQSMSLARDCDAALVGVGSSDPEYSSYYKAGYVPIGELNNLLSKGVVGDVCGWHFDATGKTRDLEFHSRLLTISQKDLLQIPLRIGVAGGHRKAKPIVGAIKAGYINALVTDQTAAEKIVEINAGSM
jgi:DNA-binding transcriptional regulator LsrR (DeoR family)